MPRFRARSVLLPCCFLLLAPPASARQKPTLTRADYGRFESLGASVLSPDGRWLAYAITRVNEERELRVRPLGRDTLRTMLWASGPVFSADSRHLAWSVGVSAAEHKRLEKEEKPVRLRATVLELATGRERSFDAVRAFSFDATGRFLALHGYAPETPEGKGADLRVIDLAGGADMTFGNVAEFAWSEAASLLALAVATGAAAGNGVQVWDARTSTLRSLDASASTYRQLAWREHAADLALLRSAGVEGDEKSKAHVLLAWRGLDRDDPRALVLDSTATGIADTLEIVHHTRPRWSDDGLRIAIGLRPKMRTGTPDSAGTGTEKRDSAGAPGDSARAAAGADDEELPGVQIWHTSDVRLVPEQKARADADARRTLLAVWSIEPNRVVQVGTDLLEAATVTEDWRHGIERVASAYAWGAMFGRPYHDLFTVDLGTGERTRTLEHVRYSWDSPGGRWLLTFDGHDYWSHDLRSGTRTNLTQRLAGAFADTANDTPTDLLPPHGIGGWLEGDAAVLLYDQYDVWRVRPDGSAGERLTDGAPERVVHRVLRLGETPDTIDPAAPLYFSLHGEWSEKRGFARLRPGRDVERLLFVDGYASALARADSADVFLYRLEARDDSPDLFVAGADLAGARQVTNTNPFQDEFAWTRAELVEYTSEAGRRLQGALLYPANHDPSRRYPMIVYTYEILSPQIHVYQTPSERSYYNFTVWTQNGYFVLLPDIVYRARDPGVSAIEAVRPAIGSVLERGLVDAARVGLIGHSWGGYQATYLPTRTKLFAASVAGAPLTDFVSFMGQLHWTPGIAELSHWETGQGRMEVPYWEDPEAHHRNSPVHKVHEMETPLLMAFGDADGVVDWDQGTEFFNFARRAGKQMVLLVYEGENHGFTKKPNQIDYHRRILEWFGHYLKGEPAPAWITAGVRVDDLKAETRRVARSP